MGTKNLLLTGSAGFIGKNLTELLEITGYYNIYHVDMLSDISDREFWSKIPQENKFHALVGDITLRKLALWDIDEVIHCAAESHVDRSITGPLDFTKRNVYDTHSLFESVREYNKKSGKNIRIVLISTDEVGGSLELNDYPFREDCAFKPNSPYSASKAAQEMLARAYVETYGMDIVITRCCNNFGEGQHPEKLIPKALKCLINNEKIPVYGSGKNIREWIYVEDHCRGILKTLQSGRTGEVYNFGSERELDNLELLYHLIQAYSIKESGKYLTDEQVENCFEFVEDRLGHDKRYAINSQKARTELGWIPLYHFEDGLKETVSWYLQNRNWLLTK